MQRWGWRTCHTECGEGGGCPGRWSQREQAVLQANMGSDCDGSISTSTRPNHARQSVRSRVGYTGVLRETRLPKRHGILEPGERPSWRGEGHSVRGQYCRLMDPGLHARFQLEGPTSDDTPPPVPTRNFDASTRMQVRQHAWSPTLTCHAVLFSGGIACCRTCFC